MVPNSSLPSEIAIKRAVYPYLSKLIDFEISQPRLHRHLSSNHDFGVIVPKTLQQSFGPKEGAKRCHNWELLP